MIQYVHNPATNTLELIQEPPYQEKTYAKTSVCIQPDPCPGCGNCLLCDSKCTCSKTEATCSLAVFCNNDGHCLYPARCDSGR